MGTNFYLFTKSKAAALNITGHPYDYELVDEPDWGYLIHIAKTSMGWKPLFQAYDCLNSVRNTRQAYETGDFAILDEYHKEYDWAAFDERVLQHSQDLPANTVRSHKEFHQSFFTDAEGYEFWRVEFC